MKDLTIFKKDLKQITDKELNQALYSIQSDKYFKDKIEERKELKSLIEEFQRQGKAYDASYSLILNRDLFKHFEKVKKSSEFTGHWSKLKSIFVQIVSRSCPVCSKDIQRYDDVDHYRPKSKELYWWLAYEFSNYILLCSDCNRAYKRTKFPLFDNTRAILDGTITLIEEKHLILNPLNERFSDYFNLGLFQYEGNSNSNNMRIKIIPNSAFKNDSYERKQCLTTIETFNLDNGNKDEKDFSDRIALSKRIYNSLIDLVKAREKYLKYKSPNNELRYFNAIRKAKGTLRGSWLIFILEGKYQLL